MEEKLSKKHVINLVDRERLSITGVTDVFTFDEEVIELETVEGYVDIEGDSLHVVKMSLESGELVVEGQVSGITYHDKGTTKKKGSLLSNLFR